MNTQDSKLVTTTAIKLLKKYSMKRFFLYIHYWNTHTPYNAPRNYTEKFYEHHKKVGKSKALDEIYEKVDNEKWREYLSGWLKKLHKHKK